MVAAHRTDAAIASIASPCINVCQIDAHGAYCTACLRTLAEITAWSNASDADKRAILKRVAQSRKQSHKLPGSVK